MSTHLDVEIMVGPDEVGVVRERFEGSGRDLLGPTARRTVDVWQATVGVGRVKRPVSVSVGAVRDRGSITWRTLRWRPERRGAEGGLVPDPRFPTFVGNLGFQTDPSGALLLRGFYDPPGGHLGNMVDGLFLHKAAEATATFLLSDIRDHLTRDESQAATTSQSSGHRETVRTRSPQENRR